MPHPQIRAVLDGQLVDVVKEDSDPISIEDANGINKRKANGDTLPCEGLQRSNKEAKLSLVDCSNEAVGPVAEEDGKIGSKTVVKGKSDTAEGHHCTWKLLPPSFLANARADAMRLARIQAAKKRIASVKQGMANQLVKKRGQKSTDETSPHLTELASSEKMQAAHDKGLDPEDFLIQYCLIRGADEKVLQAGYYSLALSTPPVQPDKEIMSDTELLQYFKTPKEIEFLEFLSRKEPVYPWLTKDELESLSPW